MNQVYGWFKEGHLNLRWMSERYMRLILSNLTEIQRVGN